MSGPPELPLLIEASVWIRFIVLSSTVSVLSVAEIIPAVTEFASEKPSGLPITIEASPT